MLTIVYYDHCICVRPVTIEFMIKTSICTIHISLLWTCLLKHCISIIKAVYAVNSFWGELYNLQDLNNKSILTIICKITLTFTEYICIFTQWAIIVRETIIRTVQYTILITSTIKIKDVVLGSWWRIVNYGRSYCTYNV